MDRREFLKRLAGLGAAGAAALLSKGSSRAWGASGGPAAAMPDLVAIKGGDPASMLDLALKQYGGMGSFVRKGQTVVVKPNIGWDRPPEAAANTSPQLVKRVVEQCLEAGAKKVWVFDNSCDSGPRCYASSQIERYAKDAGAEVVSGASSSYYHEVPIPAAVRLKKMKVHELVLQADVFINVPILKNHSGAGMTCAMKNLMGIVWDRDAFHANDLDQCIADSCLYRKPSLNIVDAWKVMLTGGPRGYSTSRYAEERMLMMSTDIVAIDSASSRVLGYQPEKYDYIGMGEKLGLGRADTTKLDVRRLTM
jgi:uncharacterized protein (DUF362 family)